MTHPHRDIPGSRPPAQEPVGIAVFAKAPIPGQAKTRLIPALGPENAAALQRAFLRRTLLTAQAATLGPVSLWCAPDCGHPVFAECREEFGASLHPQPEGDLGERMLAAFRRLCGAGPVLLIGTDCPALSPAHLRASAQALSTGNDAVLLPAADGGYVLIGLRRPEKSLFENMPWGSSGVMAETRLRLCRAGLRWAEPALLWDVDDPGDLVRLGSSGLMDDWLKGNAP